MTLGTLNLVAGGAVTQSGVLIDAPAATLTVITRNDSGANITLDTFANGYWSQQLDDSLLTAGLTQLNSGVELLDGGAWTHPTGLVYRLLLLTAQFRGRLAFVGLAALAVETANTLDTNVCQLAGVVCERLLELGEVQGVYPT